VSIPGKAEVIVARESADVIREEAQAYERERNRILGIVRGVPCFVGLHLEAGCLAKENIATPPAEISEILARKVADGKANRWIG